MPDITTRYRLELDSVGLMGQLAAVEAQAGGQIAQMAQPIQSAISQTLQAGTNALMAAGTAGMRATSYLTGGVGRVAGGLLGGAAGMIGGGIGPGGYSGSRAQEAFFQSMLGPQEPSGAFGSWTDTLGVTPRAEYGFTPDEMGYRRQQRYGRQVDAAVFGAARAGLRAAGTYGGSAVGHQLGAGLGRMLGLGEGGEEALGGAGAALGGYVGTSAYGAVGGATLGGGLGGTLGGLIGNIPGLRSVPILGSALRGIGAVGGVLGTAAGGLLGGALGGAAQFAMNTIQRHQGMQSVIEDATMGAISGSQFTPASVLQASNAISRMALKDPRYEVEDYSKIIQGGAAAGAYEGVSTPQQFAEATRSLVSRVKTIQTSLRQSIDESLETMQQIISAHGTRADVEGITAQLRGISRATGVTAQKLLEKGITTPTFGAAALLGGVPEIARETGMRAAQVLEAGMEGTALTKGAFMDELGFRMGVSTMAGARGLVAAGGRDAALVASSGGPDAVARGTQGAMRSWLGSSAAKFAAMGYNPPQSLEEMMNFELNYAEEASRLSPAQIAGRMRQNAQHMARMTGLGGRGAEYILFKQLKAQGLEDISAITAMRNLEQVEAGAGALQARPISPERVDVSEAADWSREFGITGALKRADRRFQGKVLDLYGDGSALAGPAGRLSNWLGNKIDQVTGNETPGQLLKMGLSAIPEGFSQLAGEARGLGGSFRAALPGIAAMGRDFLGGMGVSPETIARAESLGSRALGFAGTAAGVVGSGIEAVRNFFSSPRGTNEPSPFEQFTGRLGKFTGDAFDTVTGAVGRAADFVGGLFKRDPTPAAPGGLPAVPSSNLEAAAATAQISAPTTAAGGNLDLVRGTQPGATALDGVYESVDSEADLAQLAQRLKDWGLTDDQIKDRVQARASVLQGRKDRQEEEAFVQQLRESGLPEDQIKAKLKEFRARKAGNVGKPAQSDAVTVTNSGNVNISISNQLAAARTAPAAEAGKRGPAPKSAEQKAFEDRLKKVAPAWKLLGDARVGMEDASLEMLKFSTLGDTFSSKEDFRKGLLELPDLPGVRETLTPELREGLTREAGVLADTLWDPKKGFNKAKAEELARGAAEIQKAKREEGLSWADKTAGKNRDLVEGLYARLSDTAPLRGSAADIYAKLRSEEGGVSGVIKQIEGMGQDPETLKKLQGTDLGKLASLAAPGSMAEIQQRMKGSGYFDDAQIQKMVSESGTDAAALGHKAVEEAVRSEGEKGASANQSQTAVDTLIQGLRAILDLARH